MQWDNAVKSVNLIILLCILVSVISWVWRPDIFINHFSYSLTNLFMGKVWVVITALFLHGDFSHLIGNMLFLFVFGNTLENDVGTENTLIVFFLGGVVSFLLSSFFYGPTISFIGASAAIFTLTAIVMLVKPLQFSFLFFMPQGLLALIYFSYNVIAIYFGTQGNVAYISHVIGFVFGIPFGIAWSKEWTKNLVITIVLFIFYLIFITFLLPFILTLFTSL